MNLLCDVIRDMICNGCQKSIQYHEESDCTCDPVQRQGLARVVAVVGKHGKLAGSQHTPTVDTARTRASASLGYHARSSRLATQQYNSCSSVHDSSSAPPCSARIAYCSLQPTDSEQ